MPFFKLTNFFRSARDSVPTAIVCLAAFDVLLPDQTLHELREQGLLSYLNEDLEPVDGAVLHPSMREVLDCVKTASELGSAEPLRIRVEKLMNELAAKLEKSEMNVERLLDAVTLFTTVLQLMIASVLVITGQNPEVLVAVALAGLIFSFLPLATYPLELSMPGDRVLALLSALPLLAFPLHAAARQNPLLLLLAVLSTPGAVYAARLCRQQAYIAKKELESLEVASGCPEDFFSFIGKDPEEFLAEMGHSIVARGIYLLSMYGGDREYILLKDYTLAVRSFVEKVKSKGLVYLLYAVISALMCSSSYAVILTVFSSLPVPQAGILGLGFTLNYSVFRYVELALAVNCLALAITVSCSREGNPLYYTVYLLPITITTWAGYLAGVKIAPLLVRA